MAANEISNALWAGGVIELGVNDAGTLIYGSFGIKRIVNLFSLRPGFWLVELEEPLSFRTPTPQTVQCNGIPIVSTFGINGPPNHFLTATIASQAVMPEERQGHVFIQLDDENGDPLNNSVVISLAVFRIPGVPTTPLP